MLTYATRVNKEYETSESNFVSLQERLNEALNKAPFFAAQLDQIIAEFKRDHPNWKNFSDMQLCSAQPATLKDIVIDASMQRQPNMRHILQILRRFRETMVMAIQVYRDDKTGKLVAWDGQHTVLALYIIATKIMGQLPATCEIPVVVYCTSQKLEIRRNFILLNGDAKEPLDFIDIYKQQVFGVKVDNADDEEWVASAQKNDLLRDADLFATNSKFGDDDEVGAFTLLADTLMSKSLKTRKSVEVTRMFTDYWKRLQKQRPVEAKEARQLYEYFNLCAEQGITVDDEYMQEFVLFTETFESDFSPNGMFWNKVRDAYESWYSKANPDAYAENGLRGFTTEMRTGIPFLCAQLKKSTKLKVPNYTPNNGFTVAKEDLWNV